MKCFAVSVLICVTIFGACHGNILATDVMSDIYNTCLSKYSVSCVKPKSLAWLSEAVKSDDIRITESLSIVRNSNPGVIVQQARHGNAQVAILEEVENFLATHSVRVNAPSFITDGSVRSFLPDTIETNDLSQAIEMPLSEGQEEGNEISIMSVARLQKKIDNFNRSRIRQKSYDSILAWVKIQNDGISSTCICFDRSENMESTYTRTFIDGPFSCNAYLQIR